MNCKSLFIGGGAILLIGGIGLGGLVFLVRHEPQQYRRAEVQPGPQREQGSKHFEFQAIRLFDQIKNNYTEWEVSFTEQEVNSWLAEDFLHNKWDKELPKGVSDPRMVFEPGKVFLAFRYGESLNAVISVEAKVWIPRGEANCVALEIKDLRAGALPLAQKIVQDRVTEAARRLNMDVTWYRNDGNAVAILRFQADKREPTLQLERLVLGQGTLYMKGRALDPTARTNSAVGLMQPVAK